MSLQFLLGSGGSGKTHFIVDELCAKLAENPSGPPIILLVPEQATYQMEQAILNKSYLTGFSRLEILSFQRLSGKVLQEQGSYAFKNLTDTGKEMILRNILLKRQSELQVLGKIAKRVSFSEKLSSLISEARMYEITPEQIDQVTAELENLHMSKKLEELAVLYKDYELFLEAENLQHQEDQLAKSSEYIGDCSFLNGIECYIDGFSGFTPQELNIIEGLLVNCDKVKLALTLPVNQTDTSDSELNVFHPVIKTYNEILDLCRKNSTEVLATKTFPTTESNKPRFSNNPSLKHLESQWGRNRIQQYEQTPDSIKVVEATGIRSEIDKIAREIKLSVRKCHFRYRDIAVIVRDMEEYESVIKAVFQDFDIPHFFDRKEPVHHHPLIELLRASLETIISNWDYEPLIRMLKTGLFPISDEDIFILENYILAHGISGADWKSNDKWEYNINFKLEQEPQEPKGELKEQLDRINHIKNKIKDTINDFVNNLTTNKCDLLTVRDISVTVWNLLEKLQVESKLETWSQAAADRQDFSEMQLHNQIWDSVIEVLEQMVAFLGDRNVTLPEYLQILESGLANLKLGLIPATLDQVVIGTADRSRYQDLQILFMAGVSEGSYPIQIRDEGLIDDVERLELKKYDLEFAPTTEQKLFQEQFLIYSIITQPAQYLCLSYPTADNEGKHISPSSIISRLEEIFPALEIHYQSDAPDNFDDFHEYIIDLQKCITYLTKLMNNVGVPDYLAADKNGLLKYLISNYSDRLFMAPEIRGMEYKNRLSKLSDEIIEKNYSETIVTSVSALESYCQCPFKYFANNNLKLMERQYFKLEPASLGLFYHAGLSMFWGRLQKQGLSWENITSGESRQLIEQIVDVLTYRLQNKILLASERYKYFRRKLIELLHRSVQFLSRYCNEAGFYPIASEVSFGSKGELNGPRLAIPNTDKTLELKGRIDRVDLGEYQGEKYLRVIDYKGRANNLDLRKLYWGLDLQLSAYMDVAVKNGSGLFGGQETVYPGGMLYFGVENPIINFKLPLSPSEAESKLKSELKMKGYVIKDPQLLELMTRDDEDSQSLLPYGLKKNKPEFYKNSKVLSRDEFTSVLNFTETKLQELGKKLLSGEIAPHPFKDGDQTACNYCPYLPACQFDLNYSEHNFWQVPDGDDYLDLILKESAKEGDC